MHRELITVGPITIYWYSIMILLGVIVATYIIIKEAKKQHMKEYMENLIFYIIIFGIIGARIYYVIFYNENYDLISALKIWEGGIAIYGAIIAGFITTCYFAQKHQQSILKTTDILAPGLIIAQAVGRWGNFFNKEAYGTTVSLRFLQNLQLPKFIINGMYIDGAYHHPTFLYESLWCLLGFILLLIIRKKLNPKSGFITYIYFIWYGIGRFYIESLRTDSLYLGTIRVSQLVSVLLIIIGITGIIIENIKKKKEGKK